MAEGVHGLYRFFQAFDGNRHGREVKALFFIFRLLAAGCLSLELVLVEIKDSVGDQDKSGVETGQDEHGATGDQGVTELTDALVTEEDSWGVVVRHPSRRSGLDQGEGGDPEVGSGLNAEVGRRVRQIVDHKTRERRFWCNLPEPAIFVGFGQHQDLQSLLGSNEPLSFQILSGPEALLNHGARQEIILAWRRGRDKVGQATELQASIPKIVLPETAMRLVADQQELGVLTR